jgi:hypothetical protein
MQQLFVTDFKPVKAITKEAIYSTIRSKMLYAQKHESVTVDMRGHVAICVKANEDWFAVNADKLIIQN